MNEMNFTQAATLLNAVVKQATGQTAQTTIATPGDLVSVAQTALKTGYDPIFNAISQIWSNTVFATRDYRSKFNELEMSLARYGNAIRKLSPVAMGMEDDQRYKHPVAYDSTQSGNVLGIGLSVDMYKINKQETLQTNFYGTAVYGQSYTIFKDQLDAAFSDAEEFMRFNAMHMAERKNDLESYKEGTARTLQANLIGAIIDEAQAPRVVKLLTEYNTATGLSLDHQTVMQPENYPSFIRWMYARINTLAKLMSERSNVFQTVINSKPILRHTNVENMRVALATSFYEQIKAMAQSVTFNQGNLVLPQFAEVNYWQSIDKPLSIDITPVYTDTNGAVKKGEQTTNEFVVGVIHDRDALGYAMVNQWAARTPMNTKGGYWNEDYHATVKTIMDMTEKAVVLLLE